MAKPLAMPKPLLLFLQNSRIKSRMIFWTRIFPTFFLFLSSVVSAAPLESLLNHKAISKSGTAIYAVWAETGQPVMGFQEDKSLIPASSAKLITTFCALKTLGLDHRFQTEFRGTTPIRKGTLQHLVVVGGADPSMVSETLWAAVQHLKGKGLKIITGDIYIDDTLFEGEHFPGQIENSIRAYNAPTSAVSLNYNSVAIEITADENDLYASLFPDVPYLELENHLQAGRKQRPLQTDIKETPQKEIITLTGHYPFNAESSVIYRSLQRPNYYFASQLARLLGEAKITFQGKLIYTPKKADVLLWTQESKPLSLIVRDINKFSNNFMTEQLTKYLGARTYGAPGTTQKGMAAVTQCLKENNIGTETIQLQNGSGLSNDSHVTAKDLVTVLVAGYQDFGIRSDYLASLSLHGVDGTMRHRPSHQGLKGLLRAKTGSLANVSALAGFVPTKGGKIIAFAILMNNIRGSLPEIQKLQDQIVFQWKTDL